MMVMSTKHQVHYTTQLRNRLKRESFLTYPVPDRDIEATWCNAVTLMKVSKDSVDRGKVGFLGYRCGTFVTCSEPDQKTKTKIHDILTSE